MEAIIALMRGPEAQIAVAMAVIELIKRLGLVRQEHHRFLPFAAILLGVLLAAFFVYKPGQDLLELARYAVAIGIAAAGLFDVLKAAVKRG